MTKYTIKIYNRRGQDATFFVFLGKPEVAAGIKIFQNAYLVKAIPDGTQGTFGFTIARSAVSGYNELGYNTQIDQSADTPVTLGVGTTPGTTTNVIVDNVNQDVRFGPDLPQAAPIGAFGINVTGEFHIKDPYYAGVGSPDENRNIVATAVFKIAPGADYTVTPIFEYWLSIGDYKAGQIADVDSTGPQLKLDYSEGNDLVYTLNNENEYIVGPPPQ